MTVDEIDEAMRIEGPKSDPPEPLPEQGRGYGEKLPDLWGEEEPGQ